MAKINTFGRQQRVLLFGGRQKRVREATFSCLWPLILEPQNIPLRPLFGLQKLNYLKGLAEVCSSATTGSKVGIGALSEKILSSLSISCLSAMFGIFIPLVKKDST